MSVEITYNHFPGDFFHLDEEDSCFEITAEFSFHDGEFSFNDLSSWINRIVKVTSHFLTVSTPATIVLPGADRDDRISVKVLPDQPMNCFRIVSFVHDIAIGLSDVVALSE